MKTKIFPTFLVRHLRLLCGLTAAVTVVASAQPVSATPPPPLRSYEAANEVYAVPVAPAMYLVNFLLLYTANPEIAAYMPAYRAPIPQPVVDCLEQNPMGCAWADYQQYFENPQGGGNQNRQCFWPEPCQENARWAHLAPRKFRRPEEINEPLGRQRADQLAHLLGIKPDMILTAAEYQCMIGVPPRSGDQQIIFDCIYNLTNSNGNAATPLSSYGLSVTEQGDVQSDCAPDAPCLEFNSLFEGPLERLATQCGFLEKLLRMYNETQFAEFAEGANSCQGLGEPPCLVETTCAGN